MQQLDQEQPLGARAADAWIDRSKRMTGDTSPSLPANRIVPGTYLERRRTDIFPRQPTLGLFGWDRLPIVLDTSMLLNDIVCATRGQGDPLLLALARKEVAHLFATDRVREEVESHLAARAIQGHVAPEHAFSMWSRSYLPLIRFVTVDDVPRGQAVTALANRHPTDLPTGVLAELLAPCLVFAVDNDLVDTGIARRDWTAVVHNAEEAKQLEMLFSGSSFFVLLFGSLGVEGVKGLIKLARAAPVPTIIGAVLLGLLLHSHLTSNRGRQQIATAKDLAKDAGQRLGEVFDAAMEAKSFVQSASFVLEVEPTELAHAARAVAVAPDPLRASEVAAAMGVSTQKAAYLLRHPVFSRAEDRCYVLGKSYAPIESRPAVTTDTDLFRDLLP